MRMRFALASALLAALVMGCAPKNTASIEPARLCSMPDNCIFGATCTAQPISSAMFDLAYGEPMWLAVELHNQLENNADSGSGRVNTHDAHFESYSLSYSGRSSALGSAAVTGVPSSGGRAQQAIPAGGTAVVGFEPFPIDVVSALITAGGIPTGSDYEEVVVTVKFKGRYDDGAEWEAPYKVPVRVCANCIAPPACTDPTQVVTFVCPSAAQEPRGAPTCTASAVSCVTTGTFCGSNPNVSGGNANTLYVCTTAGSAPANSSACANGCDSSASPNACNP